MFTEGKMKELELKKDLNVVRNYLEKKKNPKNLPRYGKDLFHTHLKKIEPEEFGKTIEEKIETYTNFRHFFEDVINGLPASDPFFLGYKDEVDFYFHNLHEKLGLN